MSSHPGLFSPYDLRAALELSLSTGKLLIVDVMAPWCGPCQEMDRVTWTDAALIAWMKENAIAIQIDGSAERGAISVEAFPTVVAIRQGKEVARIRGFRSGPDMLDWLEFVRTGESTVHRLRRTVDMQKDMTGRMKLVRALLVDRLLEEATVECEWMWENMALVDPTSTRKEERTELLGRFMGWLADAHPPAKTRFTELRDVSAIAAEPATDAGRAARLDWVTLNDALGDVRQTVEWFHRVKGDATAAALLDACAPRLVPLLLERGWWDEILAIYRNPMLELQRAHACVETPGAEASAESRPGELREAGLEAFRQHASILYGALVSARRTKDAESFRLEAIRMDASDDMRSTLQRAANRAKWS